MISQPAARTAVKVQMGASFLERMTFLSAKERRTLANLAAESPAALWAMIDASREPFLRMLGTSRTDQLSQELWQLIPPDERRILEDRSFTPPPLGVVVGEDPSPLPAPDFDIETRDRLHRELQQLKNDDSSDAKRQAEQVERRLKMLLEGTARKSKASRADY